METLLSTNLRSFVNADSRTQLDLRIVRLLQRTGEMNKLFLSREEISLEDTNQPQDVWDEEKKEAITFIPRDIISNLLEHYSLILIGALANYFPSKLTDQITDEIIRFLELEPIANYYDSLHRYFLPPGIMGYCFAIKNKKEDEYIKKVNVGEDFFNEFLILNRTIKNNKYVQVFLTAFNNYNDIDIGRILSVFNSPETINEAFQSDINSNSSYHKIAAIGAINFSVFVSHFNDIISRTEKYPILQSALWHFYGYYFYTMKNELIDFYRIAFSNMRNVLNQYDVFKSFKKGEDEKNSLNERSLSVIGNTENDLREIILDGNKYSIPFKNIAEKHLEYFGALVT